jgi:hypothetical protein
MKDHLRSSIVLAALLHGACAYEAVEGEAFDDEVAVTNEPLYVKGTRLWPQNKAIPVCWETFDADSATERGWVQDAVQRSWEAASNVRFTGWGQCAATSKGIRIRVADEVKAPHVLSLGTGIDGVASGMSLNFTFLNWGESCYLYGEDERQGCVRSIAVHEFGHALGFAHEQNRPDTNTTTCTNEPQGEDGDTLFALWDLSSVMNYCNPSFNNNGELSAADAAGARALYGTRKVSNFGYQAGSWKSDRHVRTVADVNDDGRDDIIGFGDDGVIVSLARAAGGFDAPATFIRDFGYNQGWRNDLHVRTMADVNGDGRSDIVAFGRDGTWIALSGSTRFYAPVFYPEFGYEQGWRVTMHPRLLADINGDGHADIVGFGNDGVWTALGQGNTFGAAQFVLADLGYNAGGWRIANHPRMLADVDDDGDDDIVAFGIYGAYIAHASGAGGFNTPVYASSEFGYGSGWYTGRHVRALSDVNLDGRADIVAFDDDGARVALSGSNMFYASQPVLYDMGYNQGWRINQHPRFVRDVSGDGRPDLVGFGEAGIYVSMGVGGTTFGPMQLWAIRYSASDAVLANGTALPMLEHPRGLGDFDGDGAADVFAFRADGMHTTDLSIHIVHPSAWSPRIVPRVPPVILRPIGSELPPAKN